MEKEKTCCIIINDFCGFDFLQQNSVKKKEKTEKIKEELSRLKAEGVSRFITGCEQGIDLIFAEEVLKDSSLSLECVCAYEEQAALYSEKERERFFRVLMESSLVIHTSKKRNFGCKTKRDRYMIDKSDYIVCYWDKIAPYTGELLQYAASLNKKISYI